MNTISDLYTVCFSWLDIVKAIEEHKDFVIGMQPGDNQTRYKHYNQGVYCEIIPGTRQPSKYFEERDLLKHVRVIFIKEQMDVLLS